jgi:hypothetical protein
VVQGIVWIKERESGHNLHVVRMGVASTVTAMERAMEAGHSVLVENMGENIDAVLNPVITRSTFKKVPFSTGFGLCRESCIDCVAPFNKPGAHLPHLAQTKFDGVVSSSLPCVKSTTDRTQSMLDQIKQHF